ncbi:thiamine phosphate synthase [Methylobacterium sp. sgz302541]|uniref:thiamine phosphate synthase n=1 Tax=unclassified Methylobacterium TaxID=2615210 RepID=UPI003D32EBA0
MRLPSPLLVVTDRHAGKADLVDTLRAVLDAGARWIWFRDKDMEPARRLALGEAVAVCVRHAGGRLTVGGDTELAVALGADGVHLPGGSGAPAVEAARRLLPEAALVGISAHGPSDIAAAAAAGADYATLSPVFETASKPGYGPALGVEGLRAASALGLPVIALGGITSGTIAPCMAAGAAGVAVMGELMRAADPKATARACLAALEGRPAD